eukprot:scaffold1111_cov112-Isochrysis_galbana.AAC.5
MMVSAAYASAAWRSTSLVSPIMISAREIAGLRGLRAFVSYGSNEVFAAASQGLVDKLRGGRGWFTEGEYGDGEEQGGAEGTDGGVEVCASRPPPPCIQVQLQVLDHMPHDTPVIAPLMVFHTGFCCGKGDPATFPPTHAWVDIFNWIASVPGFEGAKAPQGW